MRYYTATTPAEQIKAIKEMRGDLMPIVIEAEYEQFFYDFQAFLRICEREHITDLLNAISWEIERRRAKAEQVQGA